MKTSVVLRLGNPVQQLFAAGQKYMYASNTSTISTVNGGGGGGGGFGVIAPNLPAGWTVVQQTGLIKPTNAGYILGSSGNYNWGGPVPASITRNGGDTTQIGWAGAALNPDGSTNTDVQSSGYRVMFLPGKTNDPAWASFFTHASGTGSYYIGWAQRVRSVGSYANVLTAMHSEDSKTWAPKGPSGGDLTIMSWLVGVTQNASSPPIIGLNFQGVDGHNIPDNNQTGATGTIPVTSAQTLPALAGNTGGYDHMEIKIISTGPQASSSVTFYVNGTNVGTASGVTNATAWTSTNEYLSRSVYSGTQTSLIWMDKDNITAAVH